MDQVPATISFDSSLGTIEAVEGDRVRIQVTNELPEHTTIHWHGVRIDNGLLEITNVESGWPSHGQGYAYVKTGGTGSQYDNGLYNATLKDNSGQEVVWSFNMRRDDPDNTDGGFSCSSTSSQNRITVGLAYVLAASSAAAPVVRATRAPLASTCRWMTT